MIFNKYIQFMEIIMYVSILAILGYWLKDFFRMSWEIGFIANFVSTSILSFTIAIISGIYFGIIIVNLIKDDFKRIQGFFLLIISLYVIFYYLNHIFNNFFFFMISFIAVSYYANNKIEKPNCRYKIDNKALKILCIITIIYILITVFNYLTYVFSVWIFDEIIVYNLAYTSIFIFMFYKFMNYETGEKDIFIMGPPRVGKTVFSTALCDKVNGEPSGKPMRLALHILKSNGEAWSNPTNQLEELRFTFKKGILFTRCLNFSTFDYPGGFLFNQINIVFEMLEQKKRHLNADNFKALIKNINLRAEYKKIQMVGSPYEMDQIIENITNAAIIVFVISAISIKREDPLMVGGTFAGTFEEYVKIYELVASVTDKPFIICITKIDQEYGHKLQAGMSIDSVAKIILEDLKNLSLLKDKRALKRSYFSNNEYDTIFPCWVENEDGKPKIENGKIVAVGHNELVKKF